MTTGTAETAPLSGKHSMKRARAARHLFKRLAKAINLFERICQKLTSSSSSSSPAAVVAPVSLVNDDNENAIASSTGSVGSCAVIDDDDDDDEEQQQATKASQNINAGRTISKPSNRGSSTKSSRLVASPEKLYCLFRGTNQDVAQAGVGIPPGSRSSGSSGSSNSSSISLKSTPMSSVQTIDSGKSVFATPAPASLSKVHTTLATLAARTPPLPALQDYTWFREAVERSRPRTHHDEQIEQYQHRTREQMRRPLRLNRCLDARMSSPSIVAYRSVVYGDNRSDLDDFEAAIGAMGAATF
ncbi:hypothetical protein F4810DRAFT_717362 [Camillea tinctor]|nr:hypothetical protein F4810DRAFT_717362 [Camillea tinctor]